MPILEATLLDTDPAGCELLLSILDTGARRRQGDRTPLRARTAFRPAWRSRHEAERPAMPRRGLAGVSHADTLIVPRARIRLAPAADHVIV
jgi:hypothetical protein